MIIVAIRFTHMRLGINNKKKKLALQLYWICRRVLWYCGIFPQSENYNARRTAIA